LGVVGIIAEIIQISSKELSPLFEVLFKNKMFSVIVEKEEDVFPLIQLNNSLKGGRISIIPLEWYSKPKSNTLNNTNVNISLNESRVDDIVLFNQCYEVHPQFQDKKYSVRLSFCLNDIFSKGAIVKSVDQAFSIAKNQKLNCVTTNLQVVYSGGYQTKVGYQSKNKMYLATYHLYSEKIQDLGAIQEDYEKINEKKRRIQDEEQNTIKDIQTHQDQILKLKSEIETLSKGRPYSRINPKKRSFCSVKKFN
jgi:chromosome segregation ATPase